MEVIDFGIRDYGEILEVQRSLFDNLVKAKKEGKERNEYILIGEHYPVITLGRRAKEENVLMPESYLKEKGVSIYHIGRGGDVTYHCPGQLIVYPILDLDKHKLGVKGYVDLLEETVITLISKYGIKGERVEGATGVWLGRGSKRERKICAIGIKCSHFCAMHGIGLNVTSDLSGFSMINPCGFQNKGVTSMEKEIPSSPNEGNKLKMDKIKKEFTEIFLESIL
ncbi:MAG: lipoyl(octanoyl) transferase LipB [Muribaculaceae bacterium]|nr:lipoyl(octanoyl) transferase LipB [Muribaculaceae bacterium]